MPQSIPAIFRETFPREPAPELGFGYKEYALPSSPSSPSPSSSERTPPASLPIPIPHFPFVPSLRGQTALVTGGYGGIGLETTWALLQAGARVYVAGRDPGKFEEAVRRCRERRAALRAAGEGEGKEGVRVLRTRDWPRPGGEVDDADARKGSIGELAFLQCDLASLSSVRACAEEFLERERGRGLNMLFCSAGVMATKPGLKTKEGHDLQFGTNVLGHFYLIRLLLPALLSASGASPTSGAGALRSPARVCLTSSSGHNFHPLPTFSRADPYADKCILNRLSPGFAGPWIKYGHSKVGDVLLAEKLFRIFWLGEADGEAGGQSGVAGGDEPRQGRILTTSCNPGNLRTDLFRYSFPSFSPPSASTLLLNPLKALLALFDVLWSAFFTMLITPYILHPPAYGAVSQLWANTAASLPSPSPKGEAKAEGAGRIGVKGQGGSTDAGSDTRGPQYAPYFIPWARRTSPSSQASAHTEQGRRAQDELWAWCEAAVEEFERGVGAGGGK